MTILMVPSWYKTDSNPTLGSFFREQGQMLVESGVDVIMADATLQGKADYFSKRCYKLSCRDDEGILTYSYIVPAVGMSRFESAGVNIFYKNLKKIYNRIISDGHKIDLIHAHSYLPAGLAAVRLGEKENIPVVVTEHASDVLTKSLSKKRIEYLSWTVSRARTFICVGEALKNSVLEMTRTKKEIMVIPNSVNKRFVFKQRTDENDFTFISIGNLLQSKRFDLTIKAFALAFRGNEKVKLKIVGDGGMRNALSALVAASDISTQVCFLGRISRECVADELNSSNVFVLPSDFETFGVVYIEAMACGLPVIGTKNGGAEEIITDSTGLLVEKNNVHELANAMLRLYSKYDNYDSKEIAAECQSRFGLSTISQLLLNVYNTIIN